MINNALRFVLVSDVPGAPDEASLSSAFTESAGVNVEVVVSRRYADAYWALCDGTAAVVSLDAFSYLAASASGCVDLIYQAQKDGEVGTQGQLIATANRVFNISNFRDRVYCRVDASSANTWIVPGLVLKVNGIDPFTGLERVVDAGSDDEVLREVAERRCDVGATTAGAELDFVDADAIDVVRLLPLVPYDVIVLSTRLDPDTRALLIDVLRQNKDSLADLLGAEALVEGDDDLFTDLRSLVENAGVDVAALAH